MGDCIQYIRDSEQIGIANGKERDLENLGTEMPPTKPTTKFGPPSPNRPINRNIIKKKSPNLFPH